MRVRIRHRRVEQSAQPRAQSGRRRGVGKSAAGAGVADQIEKLEQGLAGLRVELASTTAQICKPGLGVMQQRFELLRRRGAGEPFERMERAEKTINLGAFGRGVYGCNQYGFAGRDVIGSFCCNHPERFGVRCHDATAFAGRTRRVSLEIKASPSAPARLGAPGPEALARTAVAPWTRQAASSASSRPSATPTTTTGAGWTRAATATLTTTSTAASASISTRSVAASRSADRASQGARQERSND